LPAEVLHRTCYQSGNSKAQRNDSGAEWPGPAATPGAERRGRAVMPEANGGGKWRCLEANPGGARGTRLSSKSGAGAGAA
jgi:hypothetical protein